MTGPEHYYSARRVGYALVSGWDHIGDDVIPTYSVGFGQLDHQATELGDLWVCLCGTFLAKGSPGILEDLWTQGIHGGIRNPMGAG